MFNIFTKKSTLLLAFSSITIMSNQSETRAQENTVIKEYYLRLSPSEPLRCRDHISPIKPLLFLSTPPSPSGSLYKLEKPLDKTAIALATLRNLERSKTPTSDKTPFTKSPVIRGPLLEETGTFSAVLTPTKPKPRLLSKSERPKTPTPDKTPFIKLQITRTPILEEVGTFCAVLTPTKSRLLRDLETKK